MTGCVTDLEVDGRRGYLEGEWRRPTAVWLRLRDSRPVRLVVLAQPVVDVRHVADVDDLLQEETQQHVADELEVVWKTVQKVFVRRQSCGILVKKSLKSNICCTSD